MNVLKLGRTQIAGPGTGKRKSHQALLRLPSPTTTVDADDGYTEKKKRRLSEKR